VILPNNTPPLIDYRCNLCGERNTLDVREFRRELAICGSCGSNARFRGIIHVLANVVGETQGQCLRDWLPRDTVFGLGMSDWPGYADWLKTKYRYENTYFDRLPQMDIHNLAADQQGKYDFVISSDVFEHITQPVQRGFDNLLALLKPGGTLIFSVPYTRTATTLEHYPDLNEFEIVDFHGSRVLLNHTHHGQWQVFDQPVFHGGEGATLEMRIFCEADVLRCLAQAGFESVTVHDQPQLSAGYYWPGLKQLDPDAPLLYAYIISARRPKDQ